MLEWWAENGVWVALVCTWASFLLSSIDNLALRREIKCLEAENDRLSDQLAGTTRLARLMGGQR